MTNTGPKRPNYKGGPTAPLIDPELASEFMDILAESPGITHAWHELVKAQGSTIEVQMYEFFAVQFHEYGLPVSQKLKDYLKEHFTELEPKTRKKLFGYDLN